VSRREVIHSRSRVAGCCSGESFYHVDSSV
jgi:hypothetical protein